MTTQAPLRYGDHQPVPPGASCEVCGTQEGRLISEHCHTHGWVRGIACGRCNTLLALVDRGQRPQTELIDAVIALTACCPDCAPVIIADLVPTRSFRPSGGWSTQDARRSFAALIEDVLRGEHVELTRHGRPVAVIVPVEWYQAASADLSRFRVAGFDDESMAFTQPVEVRCGRCGEARTFTHRDDGGADYTESLAVLVAWARDHQCKEHEK